MPLPGAGPSTVQTAVSVVLPVGVKEPPRATLPLWPPVAVQPLSV